MYLLGASLVDYYLFLNTAVLKPLKIGVRKQIINMVKAKIKIHGTHR